MMLDGVRRPDVAGRVATPIGVAAGGPPRFLSRPGQGREGTRVPVQEPGLASSATVGTGRACVRTRQRAGEALAREVPRCATARELHRRVGSDSCRITQAGFDTTGSAVSTARSVHPGPVPARFLGAVPPLRPAPQDYGTPFPASDHQPGAVAGGVARSTSASPPRLPGLAGSCCGKSEDGHAPRVDSLAGSRPTWTAACGVLPVSTALARVARPRMTRLPLL